MYVCICNSVTDSDIRDAVDDGVRTMQQLVAATRCCSGCGCCTEMALEVLKENLLEQRKHLQLVPPRRRA